MAKPQRGYSATLGVLGENRAEQKSPRGKALVRGQGFVCRRSMTAGQTFPEGFSAGANNPASVGETCSKVGVCKIEFAGGAGYFADRFYKRAFFPHLGDVGLVEPHHFNFAGRVFDNAFGNGDAALPAFFGLQFFERAKDGRFAPRHKPRD